MVTVAKVAVDKALYSYDKLYDYLVPPPLIQTLAPGCRVMVPFGGGNRARQGLVMELVQEAQPGRRKAILSQMDTTPPVSGELLELVVCLKTETMCTWFEAFRAVIPPGLGMRIEYDCYLRADFSGEIPEEGAYRRVVDYLSQRRDGAREADLLETLGFTDDRILREMESQRMVERREAVRRRIGDEKLTMVRLCEREDNAAPDTLTKKQAQVVALLEEAGCASVKEVCYFAGVTRIVVDNLVKAGFAEYYQQAVYRNPYANLPPPAQEKPVLTGEQQTAFDGIMALYHRGEAATSLLFGVTGSGKTHVFLRLIGEVASAGRGAIVMVPEIALTPQTLARFHNQFGSRVAVLHSGLSMGERLDEWKRIQEGRADIVVGTRSAVFAPLANIGLIILDEEQESSYKSSQSPRFHACEVAKFRCGRHGAQLVLASATPRVESYYQALRGAYSLFTLHERYAGARLPDVTIVDMRDEQESIVTTTMSASLTEALYHNLQRGEQSIILLNRRGYNTLVTCSSCGGVATCPNCSIALTYHGANGRLMCHYCGYSVPVPKVCGACGSEYVRYSGTGTQRLEEIVREIFPEARVLRMDMDTTMAKFAHERAFNAFAEGSYDIMLGTQMVAKGLDFPNVTLVGVVNADHLLYSDDFRSFERTFGLITQVVGRCGRAGLRGRAYIQTFTPENKVIELAAAQNYEAFYGDEIKTRKISLYPPFCDLCAVGFSASQQEAARAAAGEFVAMLARLAEKNYSDLPLRVLGPGEAGVLKLNGRYRYKVIIKCRINARLREMLSRLLVEAGREMKEVTVFTDMYYDSNF